MFSPTKPLADDVLKNEFIGEIKENLNLTETACKKLQKLLLNEEFTNEISDFPSPSIPKNFRRSAPARLFFKKKSKSSKPSFHKNDFLKIVNCFKNEYQQDKENKPNDDCENGIHAKAPRSILNDENRVVITTTTVAVADTEKIEIPPSRIISQDYVLRLSPPSSSSLSVKTTGTRTISEKKEFQSPPTNKISTENSENRTVKKKTVLNLREGSSQRHKNQAELRYSDIYDFYSSSSGDSLSLFYAFKHPRKNVKPTIVCTYFNQK